MAPEHVAQRPETGGGRLADNVVHFSRALRRAGLKTGPADAVDAVLAIEVIGIGSRDEFHAALSAVFIRRHEDQAVFDEAFEMFWRRRDFVGKMIALMSPKAASASQEKQERPGTSRVADAFTKGRAGAEHEEDSNQIEIDARFTASARDRLMRMDFAQMTAAELAEARKHIDKLILPLDQTLTRRFKPSNRPVKIDARATLRQSMRFGGDIILPRFKENRRRPPPLVVLADISGSMSQYTRVFLHFLHALAERRGRVRAFLFGTRLTDVTRHLMRRDPDEAVAACSATVQDWSGGTRIGAVLKDFNLHWSRRVLGQGAIVLLITDGLERDDTDLLSLEMARLQRSSRRLVWLNPLLRFDRFEAKASGVRAMLPHVDEFRAVHSLNSLADLAGALSDPHLGRDHRLTHMKRMLP